MAYCSCDGFTIEADERGISECPEGCTYVPDDYNGGYGGVGNSRAGTGISGNNSFFGSSVQFFNVDFEKWIRDLINWIKDEYHKDLDKLKWLLIIAIIIVLIVILKK